MFTLLNVMDLPIVDILGLGTTGLGFLLATLSFRLLRREQGRETIRKQMVVAVYAFMVFSIVLCVIGIVSQPLVSGANGGDTVDNSNIDNHCREILTEVKDELAVCRLDKKSTIPPNTLTLISSDYFPAGMQKDSALLQIRQLLKTQEQVMNNRRHFSYTLFEVEKHMHGKSINLRIDNIVDKEAIRSIQRALKTMEQYDGPVDGNREATYHAVIRFQQWLNKVDGKKKKPFIKLSNFGIFGYRTLEALRTQHRLRSSEG
ncbi:MAG: peptidoglycan-binding domain-containing protein [Cyclobacteriaceae bacterium]